MRLLLDECVHPRVADLLGDAGHDVSTIASLGLHGATDPRVLEVAVDQGRILVTLDTDFGELLVRTGAGRPSVILVRRADHTPVAVARVVTDVCASCAESLELGAIAVIGERTVRLRELPLTAS